MIKFGQKLKSTDNRKYFVTSDLHFYHKRIMDFCSGTRPWNSLDEMHESLIGHWNSKVSQDDIVFHLGDFSFVAKEKTQEILSKLNGDVVWIAGNHDYKVFGQLGIEYHNYLEINFDGKKICMSHLDLAEKYGYTVFTVVVEKRHTNANTHNVPEETRQKQAERLSKSIKLI